MSSLILRAAGSRAATSIIVLALTLANSSAASGGENVFSDCLTPEAEIVKGAVGVESFISIDGTGVIVDVDVDVDVSHTFVGDLVCTLRHMTTGTEIELFNRPGLPPTPFGCSGDDIVATLDDSASTAIESECSDDIPTIQGSFLPNQALFTFDGEEPSGLWRLRIDDVSSGFAGTLNEWCLTIVTDDSVGCPADLSGDSTVGPADLAIVLGNWGACPRGPDPCPADVSGDGAVGPSDLAFILGNWGPCPR